MSGCVVFDFDGTLIDSNALKRRVFFDAVSMHPEGESVMSEVLRSTNGDRRAVFAAYALRMSERGLILDPDELTDSYTRSVDPQVAMAREMPGATELLARLRSWGLGIHLSSATPEGSLRTILESRGWGNRFDGVHGFPKQKEATLREIAESGGLSPERVVVVGDGVDDEYAAKAVGCPFVPVGTGSYSLSHPEEEILRLNQVHPRIDVLLAGGVRS